MSHEIGRLVDGLSPDELATAFFDWANWARPDQLPPEIMAPDRDWTVWLMLGGRGAGKTRAGAEWVRAQVYADRYLGMEPARRVALVGQTLGDARSVMVEGLSGLLAIHRPSERPLFEPSKRQLTWPNGAIAQIYSSEEPDALRGPQFEIAWSDELAKWSYPDATWDMLQFALRLGRRPRQVVTTTPRPIPLLKRLIDAPDTRVTRVATWANAAHLAPAFLNAVIARYEGTQLGRQELGGEIIEDEPGVLFPRSVIEEFRITKAPTMSRIVIAVDPPVSSGPRADACGIVCAGLGHDSRCYVLADASITNASPARWGSRVVDAYHEWRADRVIAEVNQGGEMVEAVLREIDPALPVRTVHATRGKRVRAEPVAALYEQGRVSHVGAFPELEDELCAFEQILASTGRSPDRADALIWALTDLMLQTRKRPRVRGL